MARWQSVSSRWIVIVGSAALSVAGCSQSADQAASAPTVEEKSFAVTPATAPVRTSLLVGELKDLQVMERVERETGKVLYGPQLRGTLRLKNAAEDQAVRLISGTVTFTDRQGQPIGLAEGREDATFRFSMYQNDRLDPGAETTHTLEVSFPAAALAKRPLGDIRLELTYIPLPYREESVRVPVSLGR